LTPQITKYLNRIIDIAF